MSIAALQMYDLPALRPATDALWAAIAGALAARGVAQVPPALERDRAPREICQAPELLLAQTCGYPLMHELRGQVSLVATPVYRIDGQARSDYCSYLLVREDDPAQSLAELRGRRAAVNGANSQSGYSALRHAVAPLARDGRFFDTVAVTGGHLASIAAVREASADICATDMVTYELARACQPDDVAGLRRLAKTAWAPNLPFVSRRDCGETLLQHLREALQEVMLAPALADARAALLLAGVEVRPLADYQRILDLEQEAVARGYPLVA